MKLKRLLILTLCLTLFLGALTACRQGTGDTDTTHNPNDPSETEPNGTEDDTDKEDEFVEPILTGPYADTIMLSNQLSGGVQAYYANPKRTDYRIENQNMRLEYALSSAKDNLVTSLTTPDGKVYLENTMDVFVRMENGKTYMASRSTAAPRTNVYRLGYYYYDAHVMGQNFMGGSAVAKEMDFVIKRNTVISHDAKNFSVKDGVISYTVTGVDPYVYTPNNTVDEGYCFPAEEYNAIRFSVKASSSSEGYLYFIAGNREGHNAEQQVRFDLEGNGEWNTYTVAVNTVVDYHGMVTSLRFDIGNEGEKIQIKDIKAVKLSTEAPALLLDRTFHTYSDKMNQVLHFVATEEISGIDGLGMVTTIPAERVVKLVIKDAKGVHESLEGVDFSTCEYVGLDMMDTGILGFILLPHENSGKLEVTLKNGVYTVTQTARPRGGVIRFDPNTTADDFYMGHRLYTDQSHDFTDFLREAEFERHPLETVSGDSYAGYDALRGAYRFDIGGTGFNEPFFSEQNRHYSSDITVTGGDTDRTIYVYTYFTGGCGENALILGKNDMLLPIPVMICKNFKGENEEPIFDPGDPSYSEAYFPVSVKAGSTDQFKVLNLYLNWGRVPLKQLSSIQFFWPYYHLSLGTTETSCISPLYGARDLWTLPDFRSMSMPYWFELPEGEGYSNQPQHTHGGFQYFLQYTDSEGNYSATENHENTILSSGPVYTDVKMDYISDDGRIKVSYNHLELPETDELRAYYEINYEVLEDISIADFSHDFSFYSLEGYAGKYQKIGYLGEGNRIIHANTNLKSSPEVIKLGDQFPYVALYDLGNAATGWEKNNVNLGFMIYDSKFTIGGKDCDAGFVMVGANAKYSLSLDLDAVTLKKGDTMKLCIIISPWGFYNSTDDSNMQKLRENTCLDGLKLTVQDGEALESVYLPKVRSANGKSAEFTVSGGVSNKAVRVYGFEKLTAPVIYEKLDGEWVELTVSSSKTPDKRGHAHYYDGYAVYYDRNGTYSYAFAFNMDGVESRTFKIVADGDFKGWPDTEEGILTNSMNVYEEAQGLYRSAITSGFPGKAELSEDESFVRLYGPGDAVSEAFFQAYSNSDLSPTGQYLAVKYRLPESNPEKVHFEFFISTVHTGAHAGDSFMIHEPIADGGWHILLVDVADQHLPTFDPDSAGSYTALHIRFDVFNITTSPETYVDIAYVGMADSLEDICFLNKTGVGELYKGGVIVGVLDFSTGESPEADDSTSPSHYVDPASGWTVSDVRYASMIDFINGHGDGDGPFDSRGTNSDKPLDFIDYSGATVDLAEGGGKLALAGWAIAEGGIDKYMWSADGGKTWNECALYNREGFDPVTGNAGIYESAKHFFSSTGYDVGTHPHKIVFQGTEGIPSGVCADLTAFAGQTVDVVFALVPCEDPDGLCLMAIIRGVTVGD